MTFSEGREFSVHSSSLKEIRSFAREVLAKDNIFKSTSDDVVLALAEAAQNIVKHAYSGEATSDNLKVDISFEKNQLHVDHYFRLTINIFDPTILRQNLYQHSEFLQL